MNPLRLLESVIGLATDLSETDLNVSERRSFAKLMNKPGKESVHKQLELLGDIIKAN